MIQFYQTDYNKPFLLRYCIQSSRALALIPWLLMKRCREPVDITFNMLWSACIFNFVGFCSGYFWIRSLNAAPAAIVNSVYEFAVAICYIFGVLFLPNYQMTWFKNLSVTICLLGVTLIGYGTYEVHDEHFDSTVFAMIECLLATISFGIMKPLFHVFGQRYFPPLTAVQSGLFLQGFNGFIILLTLWPGLILLHFTGVETFEFPSTMDQVLAILIPVLV